MKRNHEISICLVLGYAYQLSNANKIGLLSRFYDYILTISNLYSNIYIISPDYNIFLKNLPSNCLQIKCPIIIVKFKILYYIYLSFFIIKIYYENQQKIIFKFSQSSCLSIIPLLFIIPQNRLVLDFKYISTINRMDNDIKLFFRKVMESLCLIFIKNIFASTSRIKKFIRRKYGSNNVIHIIPNYIDLEIFSYNKEIRLTNNTILSIGRLIPLKRHLQILEAIQNDEFLRNNIKIIFIGKGSEQQKLLNYARKHNINLTILNRIVNDKLIDYYNKSTIFILFSTNEGNPKVILESFAAGTPVIGANSIGIRELLKNNRGLLVNTVQELTNGIKNLLDNSELYDMLRSNAYSYIIKYHNKSKIISIEHYYIRCIMRC